MRLKALLSRLRSLSRFSLRTCLVTTTVLAIWLGLHMRSVKKQRASAEAVQQYGGWLLYDHEVGADLEWDPSGKSLVPDEILAAIGKDHFHSVTFVDLDVAYKSNKHFESLPAIDDVLKNLTGFPELRSLSIFEAGELSYKGSVIVTYEELEHVSDEGLEHIGQFESLKHLSIHPSEEVTDQGVKHLGNLEQLERLELDGSKMTDESLLVLSRLSSLQVLDIPGHRFTDQGLKHLRKLTQLRHLWLSNTEGHTGITDDGIAHLRELTELEELGLEGSQVTDEGLRHLAELKKLEFLSLRRTNVGDASWLQKRLPNCQIRL